MKFHEKQGIVIMLLGLAIISMMMLANIESYNKSIKYYELEKLCIPLGFHVTFDLNCKNHTDNTIKQIFWTEYEKPYHNQEKDFKP